ncbi:MAG: chromate transporter [Armatimonadota bacterium]|nr:chromate transporter [Armatimonadota bacterium]
MRAHRTTPAPSRTAETRARPSASWAELAASFLRIGTTVYGGMWGGARELERELVERRGWLSAEELRLRLVLSTLMPSPRFIGLAGLVGYQLRGWWGSVLAVLSLLLPSALMVLAVVVLASRGPLPPVLAWVQRSVSVAVVGVLLGNAWHLVSQPSLSSRRRLAGVVLAAAVGWAVHRGGPLVAAAVVGLLAGWALLRGEALP